MNLNNEFLSENHPTLHAVRLLPHHTLLYNTKTKTPSESRELIKKTSKPIPIFTINYKSRIRDDVVTSQVNKKKQHEAKKREVKLRLNKADPLPEGQISEDFVRYINLMESDPAPNIGTDYDWHFHGGNLETVKVNGSHNLAQSSLCDKYSIRLINSSSVLDHIEMPLKFYNKDDFGYEILISDTYLGVRKIKTIELLMVDGICEGEKNLKAPLKFNWQSEIVASALNENQLIFIDGKNVLATSNIERLLINDIVNLPELQLPVSLNIIDRNLVSYTDMKSLNLFDLREGKPKQIFGSENFLLRCEEISYHKSSAHDNLLYLASSHVLYGLDIRHTKNMLVHWNHQLIKQPMMLKTVEFGDDEVVCLASNMPGDVKIINFGKSDEDSWRVSRLPVKPLSVAHSCSKLRDRGKLLLSETIKDRIKFSTTGISMIADEPNGRIELYTQNSVGDVFKSFLLCNDDENDDHDKNFFKQNFESFDKVLRLERDPLKFMSFEDRMEFGDLLFTDVSNLKGVAKVMRCEKLQKENDEVEVPEMKTMKAPRWQTDLEDEKEYRDALAKHIFEEWELDVEDFQVHPFAEALKKSELNKDKGVDKVQRWLTSNHTEVVDPVIDSEVENEEATVLEETFEEFVPVQKTETAKKSKKRIKGF